MTRGRTSNKLDDFYARDLTDATFADENCLDNFVTVPQDTSTLEKILECSKREFLQNGFKNASLRNIALEAGLTTGAIYGYFKNKNAIFEMLVDPVCEKIEEIFSSISQNYYREDGVTSEINTQKSVEELRYIYRFVYQNFDEFRLLLCCAEGSSREDFAHSIVDYEVAHTVAYLEQMKKQKELDFQIDKTIIHIISDSYVNALLEPVRHNMDIETAMKNVELLGRFYTAGWEYLLKYITNG